MRSNKGTINATKAVVSPEFKTGNSGTVKLANSNSSNFISVTAPASLSSDLTLTLPANTPTAGQVLTASAPSGNNVNLTWASRPVLYFPGNGAHVNHGQFWTAATTGLSSNRMYWDAWVKPEVDGLGYFISAGYGGAHELLWGFTGNVGGPYAITGNIWDITNGTARTFNTKQTVQHGEWVHVGIGLINEASLTTPRAVVYIHGIPISSMSIVGTRGMPGTASDGMLFVGGSHHINYKGCIASIRGWDVTHPTDWFTSYIPQFSVTNQMVNYQSTRVDCDFLADYTMAGNAVIDLSKGYGGLLHHGRLFNAGEEIYNDFEMPASNPTLAGRPYWIYDNTCPLTYNGTGKPPQYQRTISPATPPGGVTYYDSFGRQDILPAWTDPSAINLGNTEVGNLPWTRFGNGAFYLYDGMLRFAGFTSLAPVHSGAYVNTGTSNVRVKVTKPVGSTLTNEAWNLGIVLRYIDDNNFCFAYGFYDGATMHVALRLRVAGSDYNVAGNSIGNTAVTSLELEATGNQYTLKANGSTVATYTDTTNTFNSATRHGFHNFNHMFWSIDDISITNI